MWVLLLINDSTNSQLSDEISFPENSRLSWTCRADLVSAWVRYQHYDSNINPQTEVTLIFKLRKQSSLSSKLQNEPQHSAIKAHLQHHQVFITGQVQSALKQAFFPYCQQI